MEVEIAFGSWQTNNCTKSFLGARASPNFLNNSGWLELPSRVAKSLGSPSMLPTLTGWYWWPQGLHIIKYTENSVILLGSKQACWTWWNLSTLTSEDAVHLDLGYSLTTNTRGQILHYFNSNLLLLPRFIPILHSYILSIFMHITVPIFSILETNKTKGQIFALHLCSAQGFISACSIRRQKVRRRWLCTVSWKAGKDFSFQELNRLGCLQNSRAQM